MTIIIKLGFEKACYIYKIYFVVGDETHRPTKLCLFTLLSETMDSSLINGVITQFRNLSSLSSKRFISFYIFKRFYFGCLSVDVKSS